MTEDRLVADPIGYLEANGMPPPPPITPDAVIAGQTPIEMLLQALGLAANAGDPKDNLEAQTGHAEREAMTADAATKFPAHEEAAQAEMKGIDQASQMVQQLPQMLGGVAGALSGAVGGLMQPLAQIPQQLAQTGQQLLQQGMGAMQQAGGAEVTPEDLAAEGLSDEFLPSESDLGAGGGVSAGGGGGGGMGAPAPMSMLGPAATPTGSTVPTSGRAATPSVPAAPAPHTATPMGGMGGYPMMPPGGMAGGGQGGKDDKTATKRVSVPSVKNGAPVQGRISTPPPSAPTVTKNVDGKPVTTRRIIVPSDRTEDKAASDDKGR